MKDVPTRINPLSLKVTEGVSYAGQNYCIEKGNMKPCTNQPNPRGIISLNLHSRKRFVISTGLL